MSAVVFIAGLLLLFTFMPFGGKTDTESEKASGDRGGHGHGWKDDAFGATNKPPTPVWPTGTATWTRSRSDDIPGSGTTAAVATSAFGDWPKSSPGNWTSTSLAPTEATKAGTTVAPWNKDLKTFDVGVIPQALAVSRWNEIFIVDKNNSKVYGFNSEGVCTRQFTTTLVILHDTWTIQPHDIALRSNNDHFFVSGSHASVDRIVTYGPNGNYLVSFAIPGSPVPRRFTLNRQHNRAIVPDLNGQQGQVKVYGFRGRLDVRFGWRRGMIHPVGVAVDRNGHILVVDYHTAYIYVYYDTGQFLFKFGGKGSNDGQLSFPLDICTDSSGNVIVADSGNRRVELFTGRGRFVRHIATGVEARRVAVGPNGQLIITETSSQKVTIFGHY